MSSTWTAPSCVTSVSAEVWGAGGGGAGNSTGADGGGGGAGGGYSRAINVAVTPGVTYTVTVGVGGAFGLMAADATADGGDGTESWFKSTGTVYANGGGGGSRPNGGAGGNGGAAGLSGTGGDATFIGGNGGSGRNNPTGIGGGGGSSAGTGLLANGTNGTNNGGAGGVAPAGGGDGGDGTTTDGLPGVWPGGGGGGAGSNGKGGAGANGKVFLDWTNGIETQINMTSATTKTVCSGVDLAFNLQSDGGLGTTYTWIASNNPNTINESLTDQTGNPIDDVITNITSVDQTVTYTVTPVSAGGCVGVPQVINATITPDAFILLSSAVGTDSQTVCVNNPITTITYTVVGGTNATVSLLPAGVSGSYSNGIFTITGTPTVTGTFDFRVTTNGNCTNPYIDGQIVVVNSTSVVLSSILGSDNQTVCINTPINDITYSVGAGNTASATGLPPGVSDSFSGSTLTISGTPTAVGVYDYTVTTTGSCPPQTTDGTITVTPDGVITLSSAVGTDSQTVCESTPITDITYTVSGGANGATVSLLPAGLNTTFLNGVLTISGQTAATGTYGYTVVTTGTCEQDSLTGTISIIPTSAIVLTSIVGSNNQTVCVNDPIVDITYNTGGTATVSPLPPGITGSYAAGVFTISGTPSVAGNYTYTVTTNTPCPAVSANGTITVNPDGVITLSSAIGTDSQTVCESTPITDITYTVSGGANGATVSLLPAGLNTTFLNGVLTISGQTAATGTYGYTVVTTGTCKQDSLTGTISIIPTSAIVLTSIVGSNNQTVCVNDPIVDITYNTGGSATVSPLPPGITGSYAAGVFTISGTPSIAGNYTYTVTTNTPCPAVSANGTITVNPDGVLTLSSAIGTDSQTVCESTPITDITYTVSGGANGATVSLLPAGLNTTFLNSVLTISGQTAATGTYGYTVVTTGTCKQDSLTGTISIIPTSAIVLTSIVGSNNQTVCVNDPIIDITYNTGGSATVSPLPAGVIGTYSAGVFTISGTPSIAGNYTYTVTTNTACPAVSANGTITVNPDGVITLSSAIGTDSQTVCESTPITDITYTVSGGATGATISLLPAGLNTVFFNGGLTISGQTAATGTYGYTVVTTGTCKQDSLTGTISIIPTSAIVLTSGLGTDNQTVCAKDPLIDITYNTGGSATVSPLPAGVTGSYAASVFTISGSPSVAGNYSYTVTTNTACPPVSANGTITVNPEGVLVLSSAVGTDSQVVCESTPITPITYTVSGGNTGATVTLLPLGLNTVFSGNTLTISGQTAATGTYGYTVTSTGTCRPDTLTGTITIDPTSGIVLTSLAGTQNQVVCENIAIQDITYNVGSSATVSPLPAGVTSALSAGVLTISGTPSIAGNYTYTVTTNGACPASTANGTITVNPNAKITLISPVGSDVQTVCVNDSIIPIRYKISGGGTGATVTFLPAGFLNTLSADTVLTISGATAAPNGTYGYTVVTTGSCLQDTAVGSITIASSTTIALSSAAGTDNQTVCENTTITPITYTVTGAGTATVSTLPAGVTGSYSAGVFTITGAPSVAGTYTYTITTSGGCSVQTASGTITVNQNGLLTLTSAAGTDNQTVCENNPITAITYTVSGGATSAAASGLPAGISGVFSGSTLTISGSTSVSGTHNYTVTTTGTCTQDTLTGSIIINSGTGIALTSGPGSDEQTVCEGTPITDITYSVSGVGANPTVSTLPTGVSGSFSAGIFTITGTPSGLGSSTYTISSTGTCPVTSATGTITVNPDAEITLSSAAGTDIQNICINVPLTDITYTVTGATGATVSGLPAGVSGSYSAGVFTISGTPTVAGSNNYTVTTTGGSCSQQSITGIIDVNTSATITLTSAPGTDGQTVCALDSIVDITYTIGGGGTGATVSSLPAGITSIYSAGVFTVSGIPTAAGVTNYTVTTTGTCPPVAETGSITVEQNTLIALSSAVGTDDQTVCLNSAITDITYSITGAGTGATVTTLPAGVSGSYAAGVFTISGTPSVVGTFDYTVTPTGSCINQTQTGTITVDQDAGIALTSAVGTDAQEVCVNSSLANITYAVTGGGDSATVAGLPTGVSGSYSAGVFTITGTPAVEGSFTYTVMTIGNCAQATAIGTMTITPNTTIALSSAVNTDNQTVCGNTAITDITYTVSNSTGATASVLPAGLTGSYLSGVFTITGTPTVVGNYTYTVTTTGNCTQAFATGTLIVSQDANIALSSAVGTDDQAVCQGDPIVDITYAVTGGATNAAAAGLPSGITGSYTAGVFTITGTSTVTGTSNYTVTTTGNCVQTSTTGTITVNPAAVITLTSAALSDAQTICLGTSITAVNYTVSGGATGATVSTLPAGLTSSFVAGVLTISGTPSAVGVSSYTVSTTGACNTVTATGSVTVTQTTISLTSAALTNAQTICAGTAITNIQYTVAGGATGATVSTLPTGVTSSFAGGVLTITGTPTTAGITNYTVTTSGGGCTPATAVGSITVVETTISLSSAAATAAQTLCSTSSISNISYAIGGTATGATVSPSLPSGLSATNGSNYTISGTLNSLSAGVHTYTVTTTGGTCAAKTRTFSFTILDPIADFSADTMIGTEPLLINFTNESQNANVYTWDFGDGFVSGVEDPSNGYNTPGTYTVVLTASQNSLCPDTASAIVIIKKQNYSIVIPNVFTPNGDDLNDFFGVRSSDVERFDIEIYSRWGIKVYESTDLNGKWNGNNMHSDKPCEDGTYYYIINTVDSAGKEVNKSGFITIVR